MTRCSGFCLTMLLTGLFCLPCTLKANPAPLPMAGGAVAAKWPHETIRMDAEEVMIRLGRGTYTVEAVYHMVNSGKETTEWVGFPKGRREDNYPNFIQFHAWVNGKKVPFSNEGKRWLAGQVTFPGHATTIIRVLYEANGTRYIVSGGGSYAEYIVGTGSLWKGRIKKAIFTVDGSAIGGTDNFYAVLKVPQSHELRSKQAVRFEVRDFKPTPDAVLRIEIGGRRKRAVLR